MNLTLGNPELPAIVRRVNARQETIDGMTKRTVDAACQALIESRNQGQDLIKAKALLPHGYWADWLASNCPRSERMANNYIRIAQNWDKLGDMDGVESIRAALCLLAPPKPKTNGDPVEQWPAFIEASRRFGKVLEYIQDNPLHGWPVDAKDHLKEQLKPVVAELWPGLAL